MAQNNDEVLLDKLLAEYWDIAYSEGNSGLWHGKKAQSTLNDIRKLFKTQSPISQNEHQESVAYAWEYESPDKTWKSITSNKTELQDHLEIGCTLVRELFTSPPKQIPDGYSTEDEHFASTLEELAEQFLNSYEAGDVITVHLSKDLGSQDYKYCFDATGKPFLEPTNTEVGE